MRFRLRTLMIVVAILPPLLALPWFAPVLVPVVVIWIIPIVVCVVVEVILAKSKAAKR